MSRHELTERQNGILGAVIALLLSLAINVVSLVFDPWYRPSWLAIGVAVGVLVFYCLWFLLEREER